MKKTFLFYILGVLILFGIFCFPSQARAFINLDISVNSTSVRPGDPVVFNITVESSQQHQGDEVNIIWGDGQSQDFSCVLPAFSAPPATCSFSVQHTYANEGDYLVRINATNIFPEADLANQTISVSGTAITDSYDNPLLAENIVQFAWQAIVFLFTASLYFAVLMILVGSYIMVTSGGIPSRIEKGKKIVIWTLIAVAIILISRVIIELVWMLLGKK